MSQFDAGELVPPVPAPEPPSPPSGSPAAVRADALVRTARRQTAPATLDQRTTPRLSIEELNSQSWEDILYRFNSTRDDSRPWWQKTIDFIDLPRNTNQNIAFGHPTVSGIAGSLAEGALFGGALGGPVGAAVGAGVVGAEQLASAGIRLFTSAGSRDSITSGKETAALGQPRVSFSDALKNLGVENHIVRGIAGFAGDFLFDPLILAGPAGAGGKYAAAGGKVALETTKAGERALRAGINVAADIGASGIRNPEVRALIESAGHTDETLAALRAAGKSRQEIAQAIDASVRGGVDASSAASRIAKQTVSYIATGEGLKKSGGLIGAQLFEPLTAESRAVKEFAQRYGKSFGTDSGTLFRVGDEAGVQVAHIPFTDLNIQVPGWGGVGRDIRAVKAAVNVTEHALDLPDDLASLQHIASRRVGHVEAAAGDLEEVRDLAHATPRNPFEADAIAQRLREINLARDVRDAESAALSLREAEALKNLAEKSAKGKLSAEEILAYTKYRDVVRAAAEAETKQAAPELQEIAAASAMKTRADATAKAVNESVAKMEEVHKETPIFSIDPDTGGPVIPNDPALVNEVAQRVRPTLEALHDAKDGAVRDMLTARLAQEAAPLRAPHPAGFVGLDAHYALTGQAEMQALTGIGAELAREGSDVFRAYVAQADARKASISAKMTLAAALESPIVAHLSSDDRGVVALAMAALGTSDWMVGTSALAEVAALVQGRNSPAAGRQMAAEWLWRVDDARRKLFGRRGTMMTRELRRAERLAEHETRAIASGIRRDLLPAVKTLMRDAAVNVPMSKLDEVMSLMTVLAVAERNAEMAAQGVHDAGFYTEEFNGVANAFSRLKESEASGLLQNQALREGLRAIVTERGLPLLDDLGHIASSEGYVDALRRAYLPIAVTAEARAELMAQRGKSFFEQVSPGRGTRPLDTLEAWEKARATDQVRLTLPDGRKVRFFTMERPLAEMPAKKLDLIRVKDPELAAHIEEVRAAIKQYDSTPTHLRPPMRPTDPEELNQLAKAGYFAPITGNAALTGGFADTNFMNILATRAGSQQRKYAQRRIREIMLESPHLTVDGTDFLTKTGKGVGEFTLPGGEKARVLGNGVLETGGQRYRQLNHAKFEPGNPLREMLGDEFALDKVYEVSAADRIERSLEVLNPKRVEQWLPAINHMVGLWKTITLANPGWMVSEITGGFMLALQGIGLSPTFLKRYAQAVKLNWHENNPTALAGMTIDLPHANLTGAEALEHFRTMTVSDASRINETVSMLHKGDVLALPDALPGWMQPLKAWKNARRPIGKYTATPGDSGGDGFFRAFTQGWFNLNRKVNNAVRQATYMALLDEGHGMDAAAQRTIDALFDVEDMTKFEKDRMRFVFPFYSWMRANGMYQLHQLFEHPQFATLAPKLQDLIEEVIDGDDRVPDNQRPAWMREQLAIQLGRDPDSRWSVLGRSLFPQTDVVNLTAPALGLGGVQQLAHYFAGSINPLIKAPIELGAGHEIFSGRTIGDEAESDVSIPQYLAAQVRPLGEAGAFSSGPSPLGRAAEQGAGAFAARLALGGRSQDFSKERTDRHLLRQFKDREKGYRIAIGRAQRGGRADLANQSSAELMRLYEEMIRAGFASEVPRWAQRQLVQLQLSGNNPPPQKQKGTKVVHSARNRRVQRQRIR